jgi:hypothetical protein
MDRLYGGVALDIVNGTNSSLKDNRFVHNANETSPHEPSAEIKNEI